MKRKFNFSFSQPLEASNIAQIIANDNNFIIKSYRFLPTDNNPKIVKIGSIQSSIVAPTTAPVNKQRKIIFQKVERIIEAAAVENVNILCLPEMWCELNDLEFIAYAVFDSQYFRYALSVLHT